MPFDLVHSVLLATNRLIHPVIRFWNGSRCLDDSLQAVLDDGRQYSEPTSDERLMPLRASQGTRPSDETDPLAMAQDRFRRRLERDPARLEQWLAVHARRHELESHIDVESHFEHITGHALADFEQAPVTNRIAESVSTRPPVRGKLIDRNPLMRARSGSLVLATVMAVCVLTIGSYERDPLRALTGSAASSESILFGSLGERTRGHTDPALEQRRAQVLLALERINEARTSVLGFHTGYDPTSLEAAAAHLERAMILGSTVEPAPADLERLYLEVRRILE